MTQSPIAARLWQQAEQRFAAGDLDAAKSACESVLASAPLDSGAHLMLAKILGQRDQYRLACQHTILAGTRMGVQSLLHIAEVTLRLITVGEYRQASQMIARIDPAVVRQPPFLVEFSEQLSLIEQHADALRYIDGAIACGLQADSIGYLRGNYLKFLGRLDEAAVEYERSIALNPNFAYAHWALAFLGTPGDTGLRVQRIRTALAVTPPNNPARAYLHYALFKELDAAGDTGPAWQALADGFAAKRRQVDYDGAAETALYQRLKQACGPGFVGAAAPEAGDKAPIFVLGMPRTGTTLLERILGGHGQITLCGELNDFRMQLKWATDHHCLGFVDDLAITRLPTVDFAELGQRYLQHVAWRTPDTRYFSDKNPGNFILSGAILRALPQARIIHLRRQPMDACFSNLKELFAGNAHPYSYSFADLASHYRNYSDLMAHWHAIAPGRILDVDYEDMVANPDAVARRVMSYCGLDYQPAQIRIQDNVAPVSTASSSQVRQPIHARNVGGWKRYGAQLEPLRQLLGDAAD